MATAAAPAAKAIARPALPAAQTVSALTVAAAAGDPASENGGTPDCQPQQQQRHGGRSGPSSAELQICFGSSCSTTPSLAPYAPPLGAFCFNPDNQHHHQQQNIVPPISQQLEMPSPSPLAAHGGFPVHGPVPLPYPAISDTGVGLAAATQGPQAGSALGPNSGGSGPGSMVCSPMKTTGENLMCLVSASVTMVEDRRKVYAFGGFHQYSDEVYNDVFVLDLDTLKWSAVIYTKGVPPSKRTAHSASLWDDKLVIFGGTTEEEQYLNDIVVLDLKTLSWERPEVTGPLPTPRLKHAATVDGDKLYVHGGTHGEDETTMGPLTLDELNVLDLKTWTWSSPIRFVSRQSHYAFVHGTRFLIYGGLNEDMDRAHGVTFLDLSEPHAPITSIYSEFPSCPHPAGQHFAQLCGDHLVVVVSLYIEPEEAAEGTSSGVWSMDLATLLWTQYERTFATPVFEAGSWHYFGLAERSAIFYLFGSPEQDSDDYLSAVLPLDLREHGLLAVPPPTIAADYASLLASSEFADFNIQPGPEGADDGSPIPTHRLVLFSRWPHFRNLHSSGMTESRDGTLRIPEPRKVVLAFLSYIYTDCLMSPTGGGSCSKISVVSPSRESIASAPDPLTVSHLLVLGNMYLLPRLTALCAGYLHRNISVTHAARVFHAAHIVGDQGLKRRALRFMCSHFGPVSRTEAFWSLPPATLAEFYYCVPESAVICFPELPSKAGLEGGQAVRAGVRAEGAHQHVGTATPAQNVEMENLG